MLKCDNCKQMFTPLREDQQRIDEAKINNCKFLVLKCTECFMSTTWRSTIQTIEVGKQNKKDKDLFKLLPAKYLECISDFDKYFEFNVYEDEEDFKIYSKQKIVENINIDGNQYTRITQILGYLKTIKELNLIESKKDISLLENSISIGFENTRILFIDSREKNSSLFIFHPDGSDIEKTSLKLTNLIKALEV